MAEDHSPKGFDSNASEAIMKSAKATEALAKQTRCLAWVTMLSVVVASIAVVVASIQLKGDRNAREIEEDLLELETMQSVDVDWSWRSCEVGQLPPDSLRFTANDCEALELYLVNQGPVPVWLGASVTLAGQECTSAESKLVEPGLGESLFIHMPSCFRKARRNAVGTHIVNYAVQVDTFKSKEG